MNELKPPGRGSLCRAVLFVCFWGRSENFGICLGKRSFDSADAPLRMTELETSVSLVIQRSAATKNLNGFPKDYQ